MGPVAKRQDRVTLAGFAQGRAVVTLAEAGGGTVLAYAAKADAGRAPTPHRQPARHAGSGHGPVRSLYLRLHAGSHVFQCNL